MKLSALTRSFDAEKDPFYLKSFYSKEISFESFLENLKVFRFGTFAKVTELFDKHQKLCTKVTVGNVCKILAVWKLQNCPPNPAVV